MLVEMGLELNTYDACVGNAIINKTQFNICWYVDSNKLSHVDASVGPNEFGKLIVTVGPNMNSLVWT